MTAPHPSDLIGDLAKNNELGWALLPELTQIDREWIMPGARARLKLSRLSK
jgi:hypothetical protein